MEELMLRKSLLPTDDWQALLFDLGLPIIHTGQP
jgi:hypothetical protein